VHMVELTLNDVLNRVIDSHKEMAQSEWLELFGINRTTLYRYQKGSIKNIPDLVMSKLDEWLHSHNESLSSYLLPLDDGYFYHGSRNGLIGSPSLDYGSSRNDFGKGFYLGETLYQSSLFIAGYPKGKIYKYSLNLSRLRVKYLQGEEWAMFVAYNRGYTSKHIDIDCDVITGPIADDRMAIVMEDFFSNRIGLDELLYRLTLLKLGNQYCLVTNKALKNLVLVEEYTIDKHFDRYTSKENINNRERMLNQYIEPYSGKKGLMFKEMNDE